MRLKLSLWIILLALIATVTTWTLFNVKPSSTVDCNKVMAAWNYDEGQAAIAAFSGQDKRAALLKEQYKKLVLGSTDICFPPELVDYISQQ